MVNAKLLAPEKELELPAGKLDVFSKLNITDYLKDILVMKNLEQFALPILAKGSLRQQLSNVERALGKDTQFAATISNEILKDMHTATLYPPEIKTEISATELVSITGDLMEHIILKRQEYEEDKTEK